jgi:hypothetical protein
MCTLNDIPLENEVRHASQMEHRDTYALWLASLARCASILMNSLQLYLHRPPGACHHVRWRALLVTIVALLLLVALVLAPYSARSAFAGAAYQPVI